MASEVQEINVNMLGDFSMSLNGNVVVEKLEKKSKPWEVFCYLVLNRDKHISNKTLLSAIWFDDNLADPANVLKNAIYSLRKKLYAAGDKDNTIIVFSDGGYKISPDIKINLDVERFFELREEANKLPKDSEQQAEACRAALEQYTGNFLASLKQDLWVLPISINLKRKYTNCATMLCAYLWKQQEYDKLLDVATEAYAINPRDEKISIYMFRVLEIQKMHRVIITLYTQCLKKYREEIGTLPPTEIRRIYRSATENVTKAEQDIILIKTEFESTIQPDNSKETVQIYTYPEAKQLFPYWKKTAAKMQATIILALFTLSIPKERVDAYYDLTLALESLKVIAQNRLGKNDSIIRYSRNQHILVMSTLSLAHARKLRDVIYSDFDALDIGGKFDVDIKLVEV